MLFAKHFWIVLKLVRCILRPEKMLLRGELHFRPGYEGLEKAHGVSMVTESLNGTMLQGASVCSESRLYDKLPVG